jgi:hypothetical protein
MKGNKKQWEDKKERRNNGRSKEVKETMGGQRGTEKTIGTKETMGGSKRNKKNNGRTKRNDKE